MYSVLAESRQAMVNPPWELCSTVVSKLLRENPKEFIFIMPVPATTPVWYQIIQQIPLPPARNLLLPRTVDVGYFQQWSNGPRQKKEPLPFPL